MGTGVKYCGTSGSGNIVKKDVQRLSEPHNEGITAGLCLLVIAEAIPIRSHQHDYPTMS